MSATESLFRDEERTIARAEGLLSGEQGDMAGGFAELLAQYRKLYRQSKRLVKMGDRMQGQLNRLNDDLQKSEEKYRRIFETTMQGIYRSTLQGRFLDVNPAMARMFGYDSPAAMVREVQDIGEDLFGSASAREGFLAVLRARGRVRDYCLELRRRSGEALWVEVCASGMCDDSGALVEIEGLVADITEKRRMLLDLENLARCDGLTGLWNRRYFLELGAREFARADRTGQPLALIYFDIDHFKQVNDTHGHAAGDAVLKEVAALIGSLVREQDVVSRMGGEEFAILLPDTTPENAVRVAEKLRLAVFAHAVETESATLRCTASFGVAAKAADTAALDHLLRQGDQSMYAAKQSGRNRVCSANL